mmetsp:Transcript_14357/g.31115  ORF Transcript_14357/g.31115 Transcript_14357/m.31115 type:complete len:224 (-) Transcript_14357:628-1299(-)
MIMVSQNMMGITKLEKCPFHLRHTFLLLFTGSIFVLTRPSANGNIPRHTKRSSKQIIPFDIHHFLQLGSAVTFRTNVSCNEIFHRFGNLFFHVTCRVVELGIVSKHFPSSSFRHHHGGCHIIIIVIIPLLLLPRPSGRIQHTILRTNLINPMISLLVLHLSLRFTPLLVLAAECQVDPTIHDICLLGDTVQVFPLADILHDDHASIVHGEGGTIAYSVGFGAD